MAPTDRRLGPHRTLELAPDSGGLLGAPELEEALVEKRPPGLDIGCNQVEASGVGPAGESGDLLGDTGRHHVAVVDVPEHRLQVPRRAPGHIRLPPEAPGEPAVTFNMNGETVDLIPMMPSHTAGDTIVRFRKANVIYIEDFYRNFGYPFADQSNGGSLKGMLDASDLIAKLAGPNTTLIPGHGTLIKKQDLLPYRAMLVDIMAKVKALRDQGKSLKDVLAANLTAPYDAKTLGDTQQSKDRFITEAYDEVQGFPEVVDGKRTMPVH